MWAYQGHGRNTEWMHMLPWCHRGHGRDRVDTHTAMMSQQPCSESSNPLSGVRSPLSVDLNWMLTLLRPAWPPHHVFYLRHSSHKGQNIFPGSEQALHVSLEGSQETTMGASFENMTVALWPMEVAAFIFGNCVINCIFSFQKHAFWILTQPDSQQVRWKGFFIVEEFFTQAVWPSQHSKPTISVNSWTDNKSLFSGNFKLVISFPPCLSQQFRPLQVHNSGSKRKETETAFQIIVPSTRGWNIISHSNHQGSLEKTYAGLASRLFQCCPVPKQGRTLGGLSGLPSCALPNWLLPSFLGWSWIFDSALK